MAYFSFFTDVSEQVILNDQSLKGSTLVVYPSSVQGLMICSSPGGLLKESGKCGP